MVELKKIFKYTEESVFSIDKDFSITTNQAALKKYRSKLDDADNLFDYFPIFLDTNVLLNYYRLSFKERNDFSQFLIRNFERIFITKQVEQEYLKHREDQILSYKKTINEFTNSFSNIQAELTRLKNGEIKGFDHFIESNLFLRNDYLDLRIDLERLRDDIKIQLKELFEKTDFEEQIAEKGREIDEIKKSLQVQADIIQDDPLLEILAKLNYTDSLEKSEIDCLKNEFDQLNQKYQKVKSNPSLSSKSTFPGCGEKKDDPYGDFIIYHEILKFMKINNCDAIFLTNDVEKNDWLQRVGAELKPFTHYIVNSFSISNNILYTFHAKEKMKIFSENFATESVDQMLEEERLARVGEVFVIVEDMPQFPGGEDELRQCINNAKVSTKIKSEDIDGKVYVTFVVNKDGSISNARIARGVSPEVDIEALRIVNSLPNWIPGKQHGENVRVSYTIPIDFRFKKE